MAQYNTPQALRPLENLICDFAYSNGYEPMSVFNDFLRYVIHGFSPGAPPVKDWKYKRQQNRFFMELLAGWIQLMQRELQTREWFDAFGDLFMALSSRGGQQAHGQFFTPVHICDLMVQCTTDEKTTGKRMSDPTCGSGRLLLAYHVRNLGNYLVGRGRYAELGETEDLLIPPSAALAGSVYKTVMAQVTAGKKYGSMSEVDGVAFNLKKSEISELEKIGLIPMVKEYGKVMAFSAKTLFNGDNLGLQTYSVVRVFDWVTKVLMDFLNRRAFENWNSKAERDLRGQISKFLDSIQGPGRLIEKFKILRFERDPKQKDRIFLDIHLTPYFPAKSFVIKLEGTKGDDENDWNSDYAQDA